MTTVDAGLLLTAACLFTLYRRLFQILPKEKSQFLAVIPLKKITDDTWQGLNLTQYGFFTASAGLISCATFLLLAGSVSVSPTACLLLILAVLAVCLPAAKIIATVVEKNPHGFTVGGASFTGILLAPLFLWVADNVNQRINGEGLPTLAILAAISISYVIGEGIGRLACLSFGCCYGRPLSQSPRWLQSSCRHWPHSYQGKTKKISFAGKMEDINVVPVQAATCVIYTTLALACASLFFHNQFDTALLVSLLGSQAWRLWSETLRADYRGNNKHLSAYQIMTLVASLYTIVAVSLMPSGIAVSASAELGLSTLWQTEVVIALQAIALAMFIFAGTSTITTAQISFSLAPDWQTQTDGPRSSASTATQNIAQKKAPN